MNNETYYTLCPKCGKLIAAGLKFCPHCAEKFVQEGSQKLVCPQCGKEAPKGEKFCSNCGVAYQVKREKASAAHQGAAKETPSQGALRVDPAVLDVGMTKEMFRNRYASDFLNGALKWFPILLLVTAVIALIFGIIGLAVFGALPQLFLLCVLCVIEGVFAYFLYAKKHKHLYLSIAIVSSLNFIVGIAVFGFAPSDVKTVIYIAFYTWSFVKLDRLDKAYEVYLRTGVTPEGKI